jgi:hypothetical protein
MGVLQQIRAALLSQFVGVLWGVLFGLSRDHHAPCNKPANQYENCPAVDKSTHHATSKECAMELLL